MQEECQPPKAIFRHETDNIKPQLCNMFLFFGHSRTKLRVFDAYRLIAITALSDVSSRTARIFPLHDFGLQNIIFGFCSFTLLYPPPSKCLCFNIGWKKSPDFSIHQCKETVALVQMYKIKFRVWGWLAWEITLHLHSAVIVSMSEKARQN